MRKTVDTNILVRALVDEGREHSRLALACMASDTVHLPDTVLLETEWVLRSIFRATREQVSALFRGLLGTPNVEFEKRERIINAVLAHADGMDFADALHLFGSVSSDPFLTFDQDLRRRASGLAGVPPVQIPQ